MALLLAIARNDVAGYVDALFTVYIILIFIRILLSWIPRIPYNPTVSAMIGFVAEVTDPYLNVFRRIMRPIGAGGVAIDLSPVLAMIVLFFLQSLIVGAING
jgi:YggT family protein